MPFVEAANHFEANAQRDGLVECNGELRTIAVTLYQRWRTTFAGSASGPRCGFYEVLLPDRQPGSSIMPGKVNPVMCESMMQVAARVIGNDHTVAFCGAAGGHFQLNAMMPVLGAAVLESGQLLAAGAAAFADRCMTGMQPNRERCDEQVERSLSMATGLNPLIGYVAAAKLVKEALQTGKTIRELCQARIAAGSLKRPDGSPISAQEVEQALIRGP